MAEKLSTTLKDQVLYLAPQEDLLASSAQTFRTEMIEALESAQEGVVLDLSAVSQVDSLGISLVVGLFKSCQSKELTFSVVAVNDNILRVFKLFKLTQFFSVEGD